MFGLGSCWVSGHICVSAGQEEGCRIALLVGYMGLEEGYKMPLDYMGQEGGAMLGAPALSARGPVLSFASYQKLC